MLYQIRSKDYLKRAREQLNNNTYQSLFYSAFELRCGIAARLQEYLEAQDHVSKALKKGWKIAELAKNVEKIFKLSDKIVEISIKKDGLVVKTLYYTPVTKRLKEMGEKLGELMHAQREIRTDSWWQDIRNFLEEIYRELEKANMGTLLGPPLSDLKTGNIKLIIAPTTNRDQEIEEMMQAVPVDKTVGMNVAYLDDISENKKT